MAGHWRPLQRTFVTYRCHQLPHRGQMSVGYPPLTVAPSLAVQSAEYRCVQSAGVIAGNSRGNENESRSAGADWAAIASTSTSTPYNHGNRFAVLINNGRRKITQTMYCDERFYIVKIADTIIVNVYLPYSGTQDRTLLCAD